ncbi:uncharacterized protein LOC111403902 [Olea europaea var. sylvestris]|uniref:uncharacterized protein LOC111403902 n=1 Tax=Olea europaea var. sylvestris TaxID=158386 RepID=UPI000C1D5594|nr:uncharacterized protein LOC111403902 [Olea europaea var. sylvestris]
MHSPGLRGATQACFEGCCPNPIFRVLELDQANVKNRSTSSTCRHDFAATTNSSFFPNTQFTNHESIPSLQESFVQFIKAYPKYSETAQVDQIRAHEYVHLSESNHVCLDYIGVGLFSESQSQSQYISTSAIASSSYPPSQKSDCPVFGITYKSVNLKSQLLHGGDGSKLESAIKKRIMDFLKISQNDYSMVFTANRSSAFKLVAESYPFQSSRKLLTVYDHENEALETMINTSEKRGASVMEAEFKWPRLRIHSAKLKKMIVRKKQQQKHRGLFVFPLQSRITGTNYYYQWMIMAQENGWHVLLDACALRPKDMDSFGFSLFHPDFLICSFYKVFGENPTGFGCLFVKKSAVPNLEASTGAGIVSLIPAKQLLRFPEDSSGTDTELEQISKLGTYPDGIDISSSLATSITEQNKQNRNSKEGDQKDAGLKENRLEDSEKGESNEKNKTVDELGSLNFECRCLDQVDSLGLRVISSRGRYLINWLVSALMKLQHPNRLDNASLVRIYGPKVKFDRGPALAFDIYDWKGEKVEPVLVQKLADRSNISLGNAVLNHIWFSEKYEEEKQRVMERNGKEREKKRTKSKKAEPGITVVTIALTFLANFEDVYRLWAFVAQFLDADFVEKERWRYTALNQNTIEV